MPLGAACDEIFGVGWVKGRVSGPSLRASLRTRPRSVPLPSGNFNLRMAAIVTAISALLAGARAGNSHLKPGPKASQAFKVWAPPEPPGVSPPSVRGGGRTCPPARERDLCQGETL